MNSSSGTVIGAATPRLGRCAGRLRLAELGRLVGNLDYAVVSKAVDRLITFLPFGFF